MTDIAEGLRGRLRSGLAWNLIGAVFTQGSTFIINVSVARVLGRDVFGHYALVQATMLAVSQLAQVATGYTAAKYLAEFRSTQKERAGRVLGLCAMVAAFTALIAGLVLLLGAPIIATHGLRAPKLAGGLRLAAISVPFSVVSGLILGSLSGLEGFRAIAHAGIVSGLTSVAFSTIGARTFGLNGALGGLTAAYFTQTVVLLSVFRTVARASGIRLRFAGLWQERAIMARFAIPAAITGLWSLPAPWLAGACLARQHDGAAQFAVYAVAANFRVMVLFLPNLLNNVGLSILNNQRGLGDGVRYRRVFWMNFGMVVTAALCGAAVIGILGPTILRVFGKSFGDGMPVLWILLLSALPEAVGLGTYQIMQSQERMWLSAFAVMLPRDLAFVSLAYVLAPRYGARGLALAYLSSITLFALLIVAFSYRIGLTVHSGIQRGESSGNGP